MTRLYRIARIFIITLLFGTVKLAAQEAPKVDFSPEKGLTVVSADEFMSLSIGMHYQLLLKSFLPIDIKEPAGAEMHVRRARLQLRGYVLDKELDYHIILGMDRGNITLYMANLKWNLTDDTSIIFGQQKLPLSREFRVSSLDLQMVDRSAVSRLFDTYIDIGITARTFLEIGNSAGLKLYGSIANGEGLNRPKRPGGLAYMARAEILPFGKFSGNNDYLQSDNFREPAPKLSIGVSYYFNKDAASLLGNTAWEGHKANLTNFNVDGTFKHDGFSVFAEYIKRSISNHGVLQPTANPLPVYYSSIAAGEGFNIQAGKFISEKAEPVFKLTFVSADKALNTPQNKFLKQQTVGAGLNYFFRGHRVKIQGELDWVNEKFTNARISYLEPTVQFSLSF